VLDATDQEWDFAFDLNVKSMDRTIKATLPGMLKKGKGSIINIASGASSVRGIPFRYVYGTTKAAVIGLTKSVAADFIKQGIRVNAICPGTTRTPMIEAFVAGQPEIEKFVTRGVGRGRMGEAIEVAQTAVWLCSDRASFVSGESMLVDGATVCR
jgi:2-keto-3-deoxy-L-fuconate dehydrogenase